jgi:hypothetical protein
MRITQHSHRDTDLCDQKFEGRRLTPAILSCTLSTANWKTPLLFTFVNLTRNLWPGRAFKYASTSTAAEAQPSVTHPALHASIRSAGRRHLVSTRRMHQVTS